MVNYHKLYATESEATVEAVKRLKASRRAVEILDAEKAAVKERQRESFAAIDAHYRALFRRETWRRCGREEVLGDLADAIRMGNEFSEIDAEHQWMNGGRGPWGRIRFAGVPAPCAKEKGKPMAIDFNDDVVKGLRIAASIVAGETELIDMDCCKIVGDHMLDKIKARIDEGKAAMQGGG